jgi:hypothetical protein
VLESVPNEKRFEGSFVAHFSLHSFSSLVAARPRNPPVNKRRRQPNQYAAKQNHLQVRIPPQKSLAFTNSVAFSVDGMSGIFLAAASTDNHIEGNVSVRNGQASLPCGGI